jgi:hypothetical protein
MENVRIFIDMKEFQLKQLIKEVLTTLVNEDNSEPTMGGGSYESQQTAVGGTYIKPERDALTDPRLTKRTPFVKENVDDVCGLCGKTGADKIPHPVYWPNEQPPQSEYVHSDCENEECQRAFDEFIQRYGKQGIDKFLKSIK